MINNRQNGRRRGRGGQQVRNGQPGIPDRGSRLDNRARGNAAQLLEKYKSLARDAQMQGDRVNTEYYLQFADHYFRVLSENRSRFEEQRPDQQRGRREEYRDEGGQDANRDEMSAEDEGGGDDRPRGYDGQGNGWDDGEDSAPEPHRYEQRREEPRRDRAQRESAPEAPRQTLQDEGERYQDHRPQRPRGPRPPEGNGAARPIDGGDAPAERIEVDRLPQGFGTMPMADAAGEDAPAPARRRAPRRPRAAPPGAEA